MTLSDDLKKEVLAAITEGGSADKTTGVAKQIINSNLNSVLTKASGQTRFSSGIARKFRLILSIPAILQSHNPFEIRCLLCGRVISYPCWYHSIPYTVNVFHYFVCFNNGEKPNTDCLRRR